jgi:hypothetical protein
MVLAYWLIGREIVEEVQRGKGRAEYGKKVVETLSRQLIARYGKGFSFANLWYFRQFYLAFSDRYQIPHPAGEESGGTPILYPMGGESSAVRIPFPAGRELAEVERRRITAL